MLIDSSSALPNPAAERLASIQWSRDGQQCFLYLDGTPQALLDFKARISFRRSNLSQLPGRTRRDQAHELRRLGRCNPTTL